jgi:multiple sugar transport system substrate-binding protein
MLKKFSSLLSFILLVSILLTTGLGCKGASQAELEAIRPYTLEYWTVYDDVDVLQEMINKYTAERPYVTVKLKQVRPEELYPRLVEALAEDRGPDIISIRNRTVNELKTKLAPMPSILYDATEHVEKGALGEQTVITQSQRSGLSITQVDREYVKAVKEDVVIDGQVYGLPLSLDTMALYYNKDLLDRAGIPEPPKTWDEFSSAVLKLKKTDKDNKILQSGTALGTGNNIPGFDDLLYIFFKQAGVEFVAKNNQPIFNRIPEDVGNGENTPAMTVLDFYTSFANPSRESYTWNKNMPSALDAFSNGSLAFFFGYSYHYPAIKAKAPQLNIGVLPMLQLNPDPQRAVNVANYWVQAVTAKSKYPNKSWALIDYLAHSEATKEYLDKARRPTALRTYIAAQRENVDLQPFVQNVLVADTWYHGKNYDQAVQALADMVNDWLQDPPDPDQVLEWRQNILNRAVSKINQTF